MIASFSNYLFSGLFGDYGSSFYHYDDDHKKSPPFVLKHHDLEHVPYEGEGFRIIKKHFINKTALCALKGGECAGINECLGQQEFFCEHYVTSCCFNRTKHVHFKRKLSIRDFINKTALCAAKGGVCSGAGTCIGRQKFVCADPAETCCFNSTSKIAIIKKIIFPPKKRRVKYKPRRKHKKRTLVGFIHSHRSAKIGTSRRFAQNPRFHQNFG